MTASAHFGEKSIRLTRGRPVQSGAVAMKYSPGLPRWRSIGWVRTPKKSPEQSLPEET